MMATGRVYPLSRREKVRRCTTEIRRVSKWSALTGYHSADHGSRSSATLSQESFRNSTRRGVPPSGGGVVAATDSTPGTVENRSRTRSVKSLNRESNSTSSPPADVLPWVLRYIERGN